MNQNSQHRLLIHDQYEITKMKETDQEDPRPHFTNLAAVGTAIYEQQDYEFSSSSSASSSLSPPLSPPPPPLLHSTVDHWARVTGVKTDVCIRVKGKCFHLHKDPLASKSPYLKRQLATALDVTLGPPLKITAETFSLVADFCYGARIVITPLNVAALRTAAELLEMSDEEESLVYATEKYFRRAVAVNRDYAAVVFRSCLELLPEAETMAYLGSRCLEAWSLEDEEDITCCEDFKCVEVENFMVLASSLNRRFKCHDFIYKIALLYLKGYGGKITEEQKVLICNFIDCDKLSPKLLLHAVQNPIMPLRFVVRAMLIEQLNTRHSILTSTTAPKLPPPPKTMPIPNKDHPLTLGAILKRDAAARDAAKLKAAMHATNSRIRTLENQLSSMKMKLQESDTKQRRCNLSEDAAGGRGRSASFHYVPESNTRSTVPRCEVQDDNCDKVVARGQRGSTSSSAFRLSAADFKFGVGCKPSSDGGLSLNPDGAAARRSVGRSSIGQRLIKGIKNVFRVSSSSFDDATTRGESESKVQISPDDEDELGEDLFEDQDWEDDEIVVMRRNQLYVN